MRKLSFEENLRHRLHDLPRLRSKDERPFRGDGLLFLAIGAAVGIATGVIVAQKMGGFSALASKLKDRLGATDEDEFVADSYDEGDDDYDEEELSPLEELEERVLEAYHNDPVLSERAIDIGAIDEGIIELTGWVYAASEAEHAVTVARGTPGVDTVLNRLAVRAEEDQLGDSAERYSEGEDRFTESHWEGQSVGMGRTRQGNSSEHNRNVDPKPDLEDRWMSEDEAFREAAGPVEGTTQRHRRPPSQRGRKEGSSAPASDVPTADDAADPEDTQPTA